MCSTAVDGESNSFRLPSTGPPEPARERSGIGAGETGFAGSFVLGDVLSGLAVYCKMMGVLEIGMVLLVVGVTRGQAAGVLLSDRWMTGVEDDRSGGQADAGGGIEGVRGVRGDACRLYESCFCFMCTAARPAASRMSMRMMK